MHSKYIASSFWTSTENKWNKQNVIFGPSMSHNLILCVLTIYQVISTQSTALEQKYYDL